MAAELRKDLLSAWNFLCGSGRLTDEDLTTAKCVAGTGHVVWSEDRENWRCAAMRR
jgi:hypothetical protein